MTMTDDRLYIIQQTAVTADTVYSLQSYSLHRGRAQRNITYKKVNQNSTYEGIGYLLQSKKSLD